MAESRGLCKDCKWWRKNPGPDFWERLYAYASRQMGEVLGLCVDEKLQPFLLRVSGNSGCNRFMPGKPAHAKGSSGQPPTTEPQR